MGQDRQRQQHQDRAVEQLGDRRIPIDAEPKRRRFAPVLWTARLLVVAAIAAVGAAWAWRVELVASVALGAVEDAGFGPAKATFEHVGLTGLKVSDVQLLGGAASVKEVSISYAPLDLIGGRIASIEVQQPQATLGMEGGEITIGGQPLPTGAGAGKGSQDRAPTSGGIAIDSLRLVDAHLVIDGPAGRIETTFSTSFALAGADLRNAAFAVDVEVPFGGARRAVHIETPKFGLAASDGGIRLDFDQALVRSQEPPWSLEGIAGEVVWRSDRATAKVAVAKLHHRHDPPLVAPARLALSAELTGSRLDFTTRTEVEALSGKGKLVFGARGRHDLTSGRGSATLAPARLAFAPDGIQPKDLVPSLGNLLAEATGMVGLSGSVNWRDGAVTPNLSIRFADVGAAGSGARVSRLNGTVKIDGLSPPSTPAGQALKAVVEVGGLPPANLSLVFHILPAPALGLEAMDLEFAGGRISAAPFVIEPAAPRVETRLEIAKVDLAEILKIIDIDGVSGTGRIDGMIPLGFADDRLSIKDGRLVADGPGVLHIGADALPKALGSAGQPAELAIQALTNFQYDSLKMELAKAADGEGAIMLQLQGHNPAVLSGHPFKFNIRLESNFDRLSAFAFQSMTAAQELLRKAAGSKR